MSSSDVPSDCILPCLQRIGTVTTDVPPQSPVRRLKLLVRRRLSPSRERKLKQNVNQFANRVRTLSRRPPLPLEAPTASARLNLEAGEQVRVRSSSEIHATLDNWRSLKGCAFMPEMEQYCGTTQRVLKPLRRFVDERDLRVKKCKGIVLLEGTICQGTADFGPCDRCCFFFWREEWLERSG